MAKTFRYTHLRSSVSGRTPSADALMAGEIAVNDYAGSEKLFIKNSEGVVIPFISESQINAKIDALDKSASAVDGQVVTTITQENGLVSETKANVKDLQLGGYSKDTSATGPIGSADTINAALSKLENTVGANEITNEDHSIVVTAPAGTATTTDIKVNIKSGEKVLQLGSDGIFTDIKISALTAAEVSALSDPNVKEAYKLLDSTRGTLGDIIKIYKDSSLYNVYLGHVHDTITSSSDPTVIPGSGDTALCFIYQKSDGTYQLVAVDVESFLQESEFKDGLTANSSTHEVSVLIDSTSEKDSQATPQPFLTVSIDGVKVQGIKDEIDRKINALDVTDDTAVSGQYVAAIEETDGIVAVKTRANVSEAPLINYTKGSSSAAVAANDTVNQAISKLENQVDAERTRAVSAETILAEELDAEIDRATSAETKLSGAIETLAIAVTEEIAEFSAGTESEIARLDAEIAQLTSGSTERIDKLQNELDATQAGAGLTTGGTYTANTNSNYISSATSLADADNKLDAAIKNLSDAVQDLDYTDTFVTDKWVTEVDETNGVIAVTRDFISVINLTSNGVKDFTEAENGDIILSAGEY